MTPIRTRTRPVESGLRQAPVGLMAGLEPSAY